MVTLDPRPPRIQAPLPSEPYDRWVTPEGEVKAEFHRLPTGVLVRFPDEVDFEIDLERGVATGWPAPDIMPDHFDSLFRHGVVPLVGNHLGGLFLHGSAVAIGGRAVAFLGLSRSGKTTLAGAFAKAGYPILTEDVIELTRVGEDYWLQPKRTALRLFADSANHLLGHDFSDHDDDDKLSLAGGDALPFSDTAAPLARIYVLGRDHSAALAITALEGTLALTELLPHAFVLDVEDKLRLKGHFFRLGELSERIRCGALDYPRLYRELPSIMDVILSDLEPN